MAFPKEIEQLIFRGFLTSKMTLNGIEIVLKTLNENEQEQAMLLASNDTEKIIYLLAYSVFLFEKENVLESPRSEKITMLYNFLKKLKSPVLSQLFRVVVALGKKTTALLKDIQRFTYLNSSRLHWQSAKAMPINSLQFTGIEGAVNTGLNFHQKLWYAYNQSLDLKEYSDLAWGFVKIILSSQIDKKAFNKLEASDKRRQQEEEERIEHLISGKTQDAKEPSRDSVDGLVGELSRAMSGEKDEHDLFVEEYEKQLKEQALKKDLELEHVRASFKRDFGEESEIVGETHIATEEELQKIQRAKNPYQLPKVEVPQGSKRFSQQMAELDASQVDLIQEEVSQNFEEQEKARADEDAFFVSGGSSPVSDADLEEQLSSAKPGTSAYKALVEKLRRESILRLKPKDGR